MRVIDFHSHILPGIDDGSQDTATSRKMLAAAAEQGVDVMVASPHFYPWRRSEDDFLERRRASYEHLMDVLSGVDDAEKEHFPEIRIGAEVAYYDGIRRNERLHDLTIDGTNVMMLELPFKSWDEAVIRDVEVLATKRGIRLILAHLERYLHLKENKVWLPELMRLPVYVQINAESLTPFLSSRTPLGWFKDGSAHLLGSDCHNLTDRRPNLKEGRDVIRKKIGDYELRRIDLLGGKLLGEEVE